MSIHCTCFTVDIFLDKKLIKRLDFDFCCFIIPLLNRENCDKWSVMYFITFWKKNVWIAFMLKILSLDLYIIIHLVEYSSKSPWPTFHVPMILICLMLYDLQPCNLVFICKRQFYMKASSSVPIINNFSFVKYIETVKPMIKNKKWF